MKFHGELSLSVNDIIIGQIFSGHSGVVRLRMRVVPGGCPAGNRYNRRTFEGEIVQEKITG